MIWGCTHFRNPQIGFKAHTQISLSLSIYIYIHKTSPAFLVAGFGGAKARMVQRRDRPCNRGEQGQGAPPEKWDILHGDSTEFGWTWDLSFFLGGQFGGQFYSCSSCPKQRRARAKNQSYFLWRKSFINFFLLRLHFRVKLPPKRFRTFFFHLSLEIFEGIFFGVKWVNPDFLGQDGSVKKTVVDKDEGPRAGVTAESLGKLKPVPGRKWVDLHSKLLASGYLTVREPEEHHFFKR